MEIDVERMRAVRDAVGAAVELLIDANQGGVDAAPGDRRPEAHGGPSNTFLKLFALPKIQYRIAQIQEIFQAASLYEEAPRPSL